MHTFPCHVSLTDIPHKTAEVFIVFNRQPDSDQSGLFMLREDTPLLLSKIMRLSEIPAN